MKLIQNFAYDLIFRSLLPSNAYLKTLIKNLDN